MDLKANGVSLGSAGIIGVDDGKGVDTIAAVPLGGERPFMTSALPMGSPDAPATAASTTTTTMELSSLLMYLELQMKVEPGNEAYMEAICKAPVVAKAEANPTLFLRREDMNVSAAARRMCNYWNLRKQTFGERFTRPLLDLSGNGALPQATIDIMETGVAVVLPNDNQGRSVICNDLARINHLSRLEVAEHRMRYIFYLYCEPCMNPKSQTEGIVALRVLFDPFDTRFSADQYKRTLVQLMENVLPAKMHAFHVCCLPSHKAARRHFAMTLLPQFVQALGRELAQKVVIHLEVNSEKMAERLRPYGLHKEGLPPSLGGDWSYESHLERLLGWDSKLPASSGAHPQTSNGHTQVQESGLSFLANAALQIHLESRKARKRMMDLIYARERRQREKSEQMTLQEQCLELIRANSGLERENERLDKILAEAKLKISRMQYGISIAGFGPKQKRMISAHSIVAPPQSVKKPKLASFGEASPCAVGGGGAAALSRGVAAFPPPAFSATDSSSSSGMFDLIQQNWQLQLALRHASTLGRARQDSRKFNEQQSLLRQVEETLRSRNPQQALADAFFNQKNSNRVMSCSPLQLSDWLSPRGPNMVTAVPTHQQQQLPPQTNHSLLNQLLVANIAQLHGLSSLLGLATALSFSHTAVHRQNTTVGLTQDDVVRQFLRSILSSPPLTQTQDDVLRQLLRSMVPPTHAQIPAPGLPELQELKDAFEKYFRS